MKKLALLSLGILLLLATPACSQDEVKSQNATTPAPASNATAPEHDMNAMPADNATETAPMSNGTMPMDMEGKYSDVLFLSMMIPHHSGAVAMCNEVLKTTSDPQIKAWAEEMNKAQQGEIVIMLKWLEDLGGKDKPAWDKMSEEMKAMREHTMSDNADMNFVLMMIPHHAMALEMAYPALLESSDPKVTDLAKDIIVHQAEEIRALRNWVDAHSPAAPQAAEAPAAPEAAEQQTQQQ